MNAKGLKNLKAGWKSVKKSGGWFALALNGFKPGESRLPVLVVSTKAPVGREDLVKAEDKPQLEKICFGRVILEGSRTAFVIAPDSPVQGETVLKEAVRALAASADLKEVLKNAGAGPFRVAQAADLAGAATLDSAAAVKEAGGKASLASRLTGGDYSKLLDGLKAWQKLSAGGIDLANAKKGQQLLAQLEERSVSWLAKHADEAGKDGRKQAIERVLAEVRAARERIRDLRERVALGDTLGHAVNKVLGESLVKPPVATRLTDLGSVQIKLSERIATATDADEQAALGRTLLKVEATTGNTIHERAVDLAKRTTPPTDEQLQVLATQVRGLTARVVDLLLAPPDGSKASDLSPLTSSLGLALDGVEALDPALANELRSEAVQRALVFQADSLRASSQTASSQREFLSSLGRGNPPEIAVRAQLLRGLGKPYAHARVEAAREALGPSYTESLTRFDEAKRPDACETLTRLDGLQRKIDHEVEKARKALSKRVLARLEAFGCKASDLVPVVQRTLQSPGLFPGSPIAPAPTVAQLFAAVLRHKPELAEPYISDVITKVKAFVDRSGVVDPDPEQTATHVREVITTRLERGAAVDLAAIVKALEAEGHWVGLITPVDLTGQLVRVGLLGEDGDAADDDANLAARSVGALVGDLRDRQVARELATLQDQLGDLITPMVNALDAVLGPLFSRPQDLPTPILRAARSAYQLVSDIPLAGDAGGRTMVVDMLVLRWINPVLVEGIVVPDETSPNGELTAAPGARYLTSIVQCIANDSRPKEVQSAPFVPYIEQQRPRFVTFVDRVIELALALD